MPSASPTPPYKNGNPGCCCTGSGVSVPGCPCAPSPATIHMVSTCPACNNGILQSATIVYGPTPTSLLPVVLTSYSYLSTATFIDPSIGSAFYYLLTCYFGSYLLTRVFPTSPLGSPYRDSTRYTWYIGTPGNTCSPFNLPHGLIFSGGDPTSMVSLSG